MAATAYRERGSEPFHYVVLSYDERSRVEALLRYTENLGFDAVYYTWNSMNQVVSVRSADMMRQHTSWYGYDAQGRVDTVWTKLSATGLGLKAVSGILYPAPQARPDTADIVYRYTKTGMLDTMLYPPVNVVVSYDYNHRKWLDSLVAMKSGIKLFREILSYDPAGQITQQVWQQGTNAKRKQIYRYDSVQRLTRWTNGPQTGGTTDSTTYAYDNVGNRQSVAATAAPAETYTYTTGTSQLATHRQTPTLGNIVERYYTYNGNGSVIAREKYEQISGGWVWKGREEIGTSYRELARRYRLVTPGTGGGGPVITDWHYRYGAGGEREQKREYPAVWGDTDMVYAWQYYLLGANREQLAVYHGQQVLNLYCYDSVRRVWMYPWEYITNGVGWTGVPEQISNVVTKSNGVKEYQVSDHLASLRVAVESGTTRTVDYTPWGSALTGDPVTGERQTFNGQERDRENGLFDLSDRNLDPLTGRFLKCDRLLDQEPALTPYHYAANNPMRLTDPTGLQVAPVLPTGDQTNMFRIGQALTALYLNEQTSASYTVGLATGMPQTVVVKGQGVVSFGGVVRASRGTLGESGFKEQLRSQLTNSPLDAVRHAYALALTARDVGAKYAIAASDAYEDATSDTDAAHNMDRYNNRVGAYIGAAHPDASDDEIRLLVWKAFKNGELQLSTKPLPNYHTLKGVQ